MINGIHMTKLDNGTTATSNKHFKLHTSRLNIEDILYPLRKDIRNKIVTTVANINSESPRSTTTIPIRNSNTSDSVHVTATSFKGSTKTVLSTEPVLTTKRIIAFEERTFETIINSQRNIFSNKVPNSLETDVSVLMEEETAMVSAATTSTPIFNSLTTTTTRSNTSKETSMTSQTNISVNKGVKSMETDVPVLAEYTANVRTMTTNPVNNSVTKNTTNETGVPLHVEDTAYVSTTTISNSMNKNLTKTTTSSNPLIEMVNCDLLRKFRCVA